MIGHHGEATQQAHHTVIMALIRRRRRWGGEVGIHVVGEVIVSPISTPSATVEVVIVGGRKSGVGGGSS